MFEPQTGSKLKLFDEDVHVHAGFSAVIPEFVRLLYAEYVKNSPASVAATAESSV